MADKDSSGPGCGVFLFVLIFGPAIAIGAWWRIEKRGEELNAAILSAVVWSIPITLGIVAVGLILMFLARRR